MKYCFFKKKVRGGRQGRRDSDGGSSLVFSAEQPLVSGWCWPQGHVHRPVSCVFPGRHMATDPGHPAPSASCVACSPFPQFLEEAAGSGYACVCHLSFCPAHNNQSHSNVSMHFAQPPLKLKTFKDSFFYLLIMRGRWCAHVSSGACQATPEVVGAKSWMLVLCNSRHTLNCSATPPC